ncbi:MAG TPA: T9SS type A sorting domain-containing protein [Bacteroidia bacterium]|nr:T9SS type A sorting domain-containing protein [Bacteroidia bacterium]HNU34557.1 T9SS type A sorting domain-containing protein [Bacteroidia bacterium]
MRTIVGGTTVAQKVLFRVSGIITDASGRLFLKGKISPHRQISNLNLSTLDDGFYFFYIFDGEKTLKKEKIVVIH